VCPGGFQPQGAVLCVQFQQSPIVNPIRTVAYCVGTAIIAFALLFKPELSLNSAIALITIGILAIISAGLVQTVQSTEKS